MTITEGVIEGVLLKAGDVIFVCTHGLIKKYVIAGVYVIVRRRIKKD